MPASPPLRLTGYKELRASLQRVPRDIVMGAFEKAARIAIDIIAAAIDARAPVLTGHLKGSLKTTVTIVETYHFRKGQGVIAWAGFDGEEGLIAGWVEYGHNLVYVDQIIGYVEAHPFMRPAFDAAANAANEAFAESVASSLRQIYG